MALSGRRKDEFRSAVQIDISSADHALDNESVIWVGGAGIVKCDPAGSGSAVVFTCVAGTLLPVVVTKVYKTGTTATVMVALYD